MVYYYTSTIGCITLIFSKDLAGWLVQMKQNPFIESVADKIAALGFTGPAILLLEANKPLAFISSQLLLVAQPTLDIFLSRNFTQNVVDLLADSDQLEQLITNLEARTTQKPTDSERQSKPNQTIPQRLSDSCLKAEEIQL